MTRPPADASPLVHILIVLGFGLMECIYLGVGGFWYGRLLDARYQLSQHAEPYLERWFPAPDEPMVVWADLAADAESYTKQVVTLRAGVHPDQELPMKEFLPVPGLPMKGP